MARRNPPPKTSRPVRVVRTSTAALTASTFPPPKVNGNATARTGPIVAAASLRAPEKSDDPDGSTARAKQRECWDFYESVGAAHYPSEFVGACLSRVTLTVALPDAEGNPGPAFETVTTDTGTELKPLHPQAEEALARIRELKSLRGGQSEILRALGVNLFVAAEGYVVGSERSTGELQWEVLSIDELRPATITTDAEGKKRQRYNRFTSPGAKPELLPEGTVVLRIWKPHPRYVFLADSSLMAVRDILEEISLLTREIRGQAISRIIAAGVWVVPREIDYGSDDDDDTEENDPLTQDIINLATTAIADKGSAAAYVPFVLRAPYEYCDREHLYHQTFDRPMDDKASEKRTDAVLRLAQGVALPVEVVVGHMSTTFANAWQIDESLYKAHIEPLCELIVDALTQGYLQSVLPGTELVVWFDPGELVAHPDQSGNAERGHTAMVISNASYRRVLGFTDSDAPDEDELALRIRIAQALKTGQGDPLSDESLADQAAANQPPVQVVQAPPQAGPVTTGKEPDQQIAASALPARWRVAAAAEYAAMRAVDRAGARIRSKANGDRGIAEILKGVPNRHVAATLGPLRVQGIVSSEEELFRGEFDTLRFLASETLGVDQAEFWVKVAEQEARTLLYPPPRQGG